MILRVFQDYFISRVISVLAEMDIYVLTALRWICHVLAARTSPGLHRQAGLQLSQELVLWCTAQALVGVWLGIWLDHTAESMYLSNMSAPTLYTGRKP